MRSSKVIYVYALVTLTITSARAYGQNIEGVWQLKTPKIVSGLGESYVFKKDNTFEYRTNTDDALQRIKAIGGVYKCHDGLLKLHVEYTIEIVGDKIDRSTINDSNDSWMIADGRRVKHKLQNPSWFGITVVMSQPKALVLDSREYYKIN